MYTPSDSIRWLAMSVAILSSLCARTTAQTVAPSNSTQDLFPTSTSPRFIMNGTEFSNIPVIRLAPLGDYAEMSHDNFLHVHVEGHLVKTDASNANDVADVDQFSYMSCDPDKYTDNLDASQVLRILVNSPRSNIIILYSETSDHCIATGLDSLPQIGGILTTTDTMLASSLAGLSLTQESPGTVTILPDLNSYTNSSAPGWNGSGGLGNSPTTAVAMIILYSITGIITALFVVIIVTGAIRAHRHPERYGPRNIMGRGRQSRAKGIARAMLETLPIVKFGDHPGDLPPKPAEGSDIEMNAGSAQAAPAVQADAANKSVAGEDVTSDTNNDRAQAAVATANPDGTDAEGHLGCSICTEDFTKGEEVRVLPCNHKFHPDCVDPWLLNVSGTCPLCRIDLRPQSQEIEGEERRASSATAEQDGQLPPPLPAAPTADNGSPHRGGRRETMANLRHLAHGSRAERIAALRQLRLETDRSRPDRAANDEERSGLARRFRERFRIRTERRGTTITE